MGRQHSSEHDLLCPRLWSRFLKRHFKCADLDDLNAQLPLRIEDGEKFCFGIEPIPLPERVRPRLFERAYELGRNPDGNYVLELDDENSRFNLFTRVSQRVPCSEPWLLKDLRPYMLDEVPAIDWSFFILPRLLAALDVMLVHAGPLDGWEKVDPDGVSQAEQVSFEGLVEAAVPQCLALLFSVAHIATWYQPPRHPEAPSNFIRAAYDAVDQFSASLYRRGFDDATLIGEPLCRLLRSAVADIHLWGARTMPSEGKLGPMLGRRLILLPNSDSLRVPLQQLHSHGTYGFEMFFASARDDRRFNFTHDELESAARELLEASSRVRDRLISQAEALFI